jgi:L-asparaginase II
MPTLQVETVLAGIPFVFDIRGKRVESVHNVAFCIADASGFIGAGTIDEPVFLRSAWKPFFAAAMLHANDRFEFSDAEVAVMCASHVAEPMQLAAVQSILKKIDVPASALRCGRPSDTDFWDDPRLLSDPCSGKHAAMLAFCRILEAPLDGYLELTHPVQQRIRIFCESLAGERFTEDRIAIDGCGAPVYAVTLRSAARLFCELACATGGESTKTAALRRVREAGVRYPDLIGGSATFDSTVMRSIGDGLYSKFGVGGVQCVGIPALRTGIALKVVDGADHAGPPSMLSLLEALQIYRAAEHIDLASFAEERVRNIANVVVGRVAAIRHPLTYSVCRASS